MSRSAPNFRLVAVRCASGNRGPGKGAFVELVDAAGNPVRILESGAGITVPKQQVNPMNYQNARTRAEWLPPAAGTYWLRFQGGGGRFEIAITIA